MNSEFVLSQGAGHKLETAIARNDGDINDVEWLSAGGNFKTISLLRLRRVRLVPIDENVAKHEVFASLRPDTETTPKYTVDADGNIHFIVTSNGFTAEHWITYFENEKKDSTGKSYKVSDRAKGVLRNATEAPTNGVVYHMVVRPGSKIVSRDRITKKIRAFATAKGWVTPHWEVGPLIRDMFTDEQLEQMGLWYIVAMHDSIVSDDGPGLLCAYRFDGGRLLRANYGRPGVKWDDLGGFGFVVPQGAEILEPKS